MTIEYTRTIETIFVHRRDIDPIVYGEGTRVELVSEAPGAKARFLRIKQYQEGDKEERFVELDPDELDVIYQQAKILLAQPAGSVGLVDELRAQE